MKPTFRGEEETSSAKGVKQRNLSMASISHRQVLSLLLLVSSAACAVSIDVEYCSNSSNLYP